MSITYFDSSRLTLVTMAVPEKICKVKINGNTNGPIPYSQLLDLRSAQTLNGRVSTETTAEFLKGLPSYNESNFSRFQPDTICKNTAMKKSTVYFPSKDHPSEQIITTEKTTILLRYLQQQYEKNQKALLKREQDKAGPSGASPVPKKKSRMQSSKI